MNNFGLPIRVDRDETAAIRLNAAGYLRNLIYRPYGTRRLLERRLLRGESGASYTR